jgi:uncharacterized membrane protein
MASEESSPPQANNEPSADEPLEGELTSSQLKEVISLEVHKAIVRESFSGPMPRPDHLERYDAIVPGAAKDILEEFKANGAHAREVEVLAIRGAIGNDKRGQWMAFTLLILGFGLIAYLSASNQPVVAGVVAGTLLVAVITGFLTNKKDKNSTTPTEED